MVAHRWRSARRRGRALRLLFAGLLVICLAGCPGTDRRPEPRAGVAGTVTYDGQPLPGGSIAFVSADDPGMRVTCLIRPDGSYAVSDAPVGTVRVAIETDSVRLGDPDNYVAIPARYATSEHSGLTAQITAGGENQRDFRLVSDS